VSLRRFPIIGEKPAKGKTVMLRHDGLSLQERLMSLHHLKRLMTCHYRPEVNLIASPQRLMSLHHLVCFQSCQ